MGQFFQIFQGFKVGAPGWFFMWLLLFAAVFMIALAIERIYFTAAGADTVDNYNKYSGLPGDIPLFVYQQLWSGGFSYNSYLY